jgi:Protein of unknown function (DUF4038)/Putative collagen-binding domain of a collagenase
VAISQRTRTLGTAASGVGFTVGFPTGAAVGDLVILCVANAGTASPAAPTGWTRFYAASAGTGQNFAVYSAPWSSGLTGSFTNAASAAAWACNCFLSDSAAGDQIDLDAFTAATNVTNNTSLPVGNPTVGGIGGCYEVLCYGWTSTGTITTAAAGTTIDGTQAGTAISAAIGHNNTTSLAAGTVLALGNATLSAANTRKTGVGVILRDSRGVSRTATPVTASVQETRRRARVSWATLDIPSAVVQRAATPITVSLLATFTRASTPVTVSLATTAFTRTATPVTVSLSTAAITRTATPVTVALSASAVTRTATPVTVALSASALVRTATPNSVALSSTNLTRAAAPVTAALFAGGTPRRARVSWAHLELPDPPAALIRSATVTVALRGTTTRTVTPVTASLSGTTPFIAAVAPGGRYMLDQLGQPIFIQGDSPQGILARFSAANMATFFSGQSSRGYNASQIHLVLTDGNGMSGNAGGLNFNGDAPFTNMSNLTGPVAAYWNYVDQMLTLAEQNGITVFASPCENISMFPTIAGMSGAQCFAFGQFVGGRYASRPNIIWSFGNDWGTDEWPTSDANNRQMLAGMRAAGDNHLVVTWLDPEMTSWDLATWDTLHALILDYAYTLPYWQSEQAWLDTSPGSPQPNFFGEGNYENEHLNAWSGITVTTNETLRRTAWWPVTWGACGQFFGQRDVWRGNPTWTTAVTTQAAQENWKVAQLLRSLPWWNLQPDFSHTLITSGFGTHNTSEDTDPLVNDFATAAITSDRHLAVIYVPTVRSWVIETTALIGTVSGFWFDPTTGTRTTATAPWTIPATAHADGTHDWVLVLQSTSRTATPVTVALSLAATTRTRTASPITVALSGASQRLASPVNVSLQGASTRVSSPIVAALAASNLQRTATPISAALATIGTRTSSPVTAAVSASGVRRTATPVSASVLSQFLRSAQPVSATLQTTNAVRTASPVTVSVSAFRVASPVTVSLLAIRAASPVTVVLSTVLLNRTASPITAALSASGVSRTATPVTTALQAQAVSRTATAVTVALSAALPRTGTPVTAALSGAATARLATPISVALQQQGTRTATSVSVALQGVLLRRATPVTAALVRPRVATPVTVSLSLLARTRIAHPVTVALEREGELPPARALTVSGGRTFGASVGGGRGGLTVKEG